MTDSLQPNESGTSAVAKAFATYAMVPYLGILFCPGAVIVGSVGLIRSQGSSPLSRKSCYTSIAAGLLITLLQIVLWWILYKIPEWARR